jgi:hypothetical protein
MDATAEQAAETAFGRFKTDLVIWATVAAVLIALVAIFAPIGASLVDKYLGRNEQQRETQLEEAIEKKLDERNEARIKALSDKIDECRQTIPAGSRTGNAPSRKP